MSHSPVRDQLRPDVSDNEAGLSDVGSALAASSIIDQYAYASSDAPSSPSLHSHALAASASGGTLRESESVPGYFNVKALSPPGSAGLTGPTMSAMSGAEAGPSPRTPSHPHVAPTPPLLHGGALMAESLSRESTYSEESSKAAFRSVDASPAIELTGHGQGQVQDDRTQPFAEATARNSSAPPIVRPPPRGKRPPPSMTTAPTEDDSHGSAQAAASASYDATAKGPSLTRMTNAGANDDSGSEASHYDDQSEEPSNFPLSPGGRSAGAASGVSIPSATDKMEDNVGDAFTNAVDSPDVPLRRSSARTSPQLQMRASHDSTIPSPSSKSSARPLREKISSSSVVRVPQESTGETAVASDATDAKSDRDLSAESATGSRKGSSATIDGNRSNDQAEFTARQQAEIEEQLSATADPSRPRTLKEARALAKERARQRLEAAKGHVDGVPSDEVVPNVDGSSDGRSEGVGVPRTQMDPSALPDQAVTQATVADGAKGTNVDNMGDLQAAIGDALHDLSFASNTTTASSEGQPSFVRRRSSNNDSAAHDNTLGRSSSLRPFGHDGHQFRDVDSESNTGASVASTAFDSARESPIPPSPWSVSLSVDSAAAAAADVSIDPSKGASPTIPQGPAPSVATRPNALDATPADPKVIRGPAFIGASSSSYTSHDNPATPTSHSAFATNFAPYAMHTQQRHTAPNKIARLDVYGKTIPWPPAFDPSAIIEQKRLAPWERARSYAHYCNDLCTTSTGLQIWLEMVQRPAQRQAVAMQHQHLERSSDVAQHARTDSGAGYAPSVRSDMTFPMRGDGGRARELRARGPSEATILESPADRLPPNLPYPLLAQRQQEQSSPAQAPTGMTASASNLLLRQQGKAQSDATSSSHGQAGAADRTQPRNFFQNLGRRGSSRRPGGSGSVGMSLSPLLGSNPRSPSMAPFVSTPTKTTQQGSGLNPSVSQPSLVYNEQPSPSIPGVSPQIGGKRMLGEHEPSGWHGMSSSVSMSLSRASPMGPRPPGSANSSQSSGSGATHQSNLHSDTHTGPGPPLRSSSAANAHGLGTDLNKRQAADGSMRSVSPKNAAVPLPGVTPHNAGLRSANGRRPSHGGNGDAATSPSLGNGGLLGLAGLRRGSNSIRRTSLGSGSGGNGGTSTGGNANLAKHTRAPSQPIPTAAEGAALDKLSDVLPDADRTTLLTYLRRAGGNDLVAIGDYLQDRSKGDQAKRML